MSRQINPNYRIGKYAVRDIVEEYIKTSQLTPYEAYLAGQTLKYIFRYPKKGGAADLCKAKDFLNWLTEERLKVEKELYNFD